MVKAAPALIETGVRGAYLLVIPVHTELSFRAGALGRVHLSPGRYAYAGSALGPGGLKSRIARHCRAEKVLHWHIDYLTALAPVAAVVTRPGEARLECDWAGALLRLPDADVPIPKFGASDCRGGCPGHLIRLPDYFDTSQLEAVLWQIRT